MSYPRGASVEAASWSDPDTPDAYTRNKDFLGLSGIEVVLT
jgi:hypothetical protein